MLFTQICIRMMEGMYLKGWLLEVVQADMPVFGFWGLMVICSVWSPYFLQLRWNWSGDWYWVMLKYCVVACGSSGVDISFIQLPPLLEWELLGKDWGLNMKATPTYSCSTWCKVFILLLTLTGKIPGQPEEDKFEVIKVFPFWMYKFQP